MFDLTLLAAYDRKRQQASSPISKPIGIVHHAQESPKSAAQFRHWDGFFAARLVCIAAIIGSKNPAAGPRP
jgi:hypothetical protein